MWSWGRGISLRLTSFPRIVFVWFFIWIMSHNLPVGYQIDGLVQNCSISSALAMEMPSLALSHRNMLACGRRKDACLFIYLSCKIDHIEERFIFIFVEAKVQRTKGCCLSTTTICRYVGGNATSACKFRALGPLILSWINLNPGMEK